MSERPDVDRGRQGERAAAPEQARSDGAENEDIDGLPLYRSYWYYVTNIRGYNSTDDAFIDGDRAAISAKILGRIVEMAAEEGDTVRKGEVLVRLDDADLRAQEGLAQAGLDDARQNIGLAQVNELRAEDDFTRAETQFKTKVIPQEQYEHARSALAAARMQLKMAQTRVATAEAQLAVRTSLSNTVISAPMGGVVAKRYALAGDVVQAGQPILSVYDLSSVWITANFEETKLSSLRLNDPVEISVDAYPDRSFTGRLVQFGASTASQYSLIPPNNASGNYTKGTQRVPVKIAFGNYGGGTDPQHPLLPGMSVEVRVKVR